MFGDFDVSMQAKWARLERCAVPVVDPDTRQTLNLENSYSHL